MKIKEFIKCLEKYDGEKELYFDFDDLGIDVATKDFKIKEWKACIDILPIVSSESEEEDW